MFANKPKGDEISYLEGTKRYKKWFTPLVWLSSILDFFPRFLCVMEMEVTPLGD